MNQLDLFFVCIDFKFHILNLLEIACSSQSFFFVVEKIDTSIDVSKFFFWMLISIQKIHHKGRPGGSDVTYKMHSIHCIHLHETLLFFPIFH